MTEKSDHVTLSTISPQGARFALDTLLGLASGEDLSCYCCICQHCALGTSDGLTIKCCAGCDKWTPICEQKYVSKCIHYRKKQE